MLSDRSEALIDFDVFVDINFRSDVDSVVVALRLKLFEH